MFRMHLNFSSKGKVLSADVWPIPYFCSCVDTVCKQWTECMSITQTTRDSPSIAEYTTFWRPTVTLKVSTHTLLKSFSFSPIVEFNLCAWQILPGLQSSNPKTTHKWSVLTAKRESCRPSVKSTRILLLQLILHVKSLDATVMDSGMRVLTQIRQAMDNKMLSEVLRLLPSL